MKTIPGRIRACTGLLLLGIAAGAVAQDDPGAWLARMNEALTTRNYDGVFVHVSDGRMETLRIIHRVQDGEVRERLVSLDGSGREFIRTGSELTCYLPDQRMVLVERRTAGRTLLGSLPAFDAGVSDVYEIRGLARARLMGRMARVVAVEPKDQYRYGYRLWIDESTAMPLKTQLCDRQGRVIEQIKFASLTLATNIPDAAFQPQVAAEGFRWLRTGGDPARTLRAVFWGAFELPPGFRLQARSAQLLPGSLEPVAHLVYSDGLASVSVFVERRRSAPGDQPLPAPARFGSSSAFSTMVDGHRVTAVGEVPPATVRFIASAVKAGEGGH
ncbi:MAG: MucB/RseB C-terminal domain-containing protein [Gammaproteobacteria bacterium]|nr:MucB/RseB C-terminal domain-containing protein [Gammaproteobacteria bacterium]